VTTVAALAVLAPASAASPDTIASRDFVPGEVIVAFAPGSAPAGERADARAAVDASVAERLLLPRTQVLALEGEDGVREAVRALEEMPGVEYAEPNGLAQISAVPNDLRFASHQWSLRNTGQPIPPPAGTPGTPGADIDAVPAWDVTTGDSDVTVAVVDTGVALQHPDIAPNVWANPGESGAGKEANLIDDDGNGFVDDAVGWDFVGHPGLAAQDNQPTDLNGHGTHVAGTIGARGNDGVGTTGVAWDVGLMALRVTNAGGSAPSSAIANAFVYADAEGADVVNASLGGAAFSQAVADAVAEAPDTLFVVAAGNGGSDGAGDDNDSTPTYPCNIPAPNLICVASTTKTDDLSSFSNFGPVSVDLAAPGSQVFSSYSRDVLDLELEEGFEGDLGAAGWTTGAVNGVVNTWGRTDAFSFAGSWSLADSPGGNYVANTDSFARSPAVNLTGERDCTVDGRAKTDLGDFDVLAVESLNGAQWQTSLVIGVDDDDLAFSADAARLDDLAGAVFQFRFVSDGNASVDDGAYVDQVELVCYGPLLSFLSGTSMASPHVAGVAALLLSSLPDASVAELRAALRGGVDELPALATKVATGGRLNALNALAELDAGGLTTVITRAPKNRIKTRRRKVTVRYEFEPRVPAGTRCRLDGGPFKPCAGTRSYRVRRGAHTFSVRAERSVGPGPVATDSFRVVRKRR